MDMSEEVKVLGRGWNYFRKFLDREKVDDSYWNDAVHECASETPYEHALSVVMLQELSAIKDFGKKSCEDRIYYNVFNDCVNLVKSDKTFTECGKESISLTEKYKYYYGINSFLKGMLEATLEEIARREG